MQYKETWIKDCFVGKRRFKRKKEKIVFLPWLERRYVHVDYRTYHLCAQRRGCCVPFKQTNNGKVKFFIGTLASQKRR